MVECFKEERVWAVFAVRSGRNISKKMAIGKTHDALIQTFLEEVLCPDAGWQRASSCSVSKNDFFSLALSCYIPKSNGQQEFSHTSKCHIIAYLWPHIQKTAKNGRKIASSPLPNNGNLFSGHNEGNQPLQMPLRNSQNKNKQEPIIFQLCVGNWFFFICFFSHLRARKNGGNNRRTTKIFPQ